jgi:O-antigen/teichoic acid export membrane protein
MTWLSRSLRGPGSGQRLGHAALQSVAIQIAVVLLNLVTGIITARYLGAAGRGVYAAATLWPPVLGTAAIAGLADGALINIRRDPADARSIGSASALLCMAVATLLIVAAFLAMPVLLKAESGDVLTLARWTLLFTYVTVVGGLTKHLLSGLGLYPLANASVFLPHLIHMGLLVAFMLNGALTVITAIWSVVLGGLISVLLMLPVIFNNMAGGPLQLREAYRRLFAYARRAVWSDLLSLTTRWSDRLLLVGLLPARELGIYVVGYSFSRVLTIATPAPSLLLSALSDPSTRSAKALHDLALRLSAASLAVVSILGLTFATELLRFFYGAEFTAAAALIRILIIQAFLDRLASITSQLFNASGRPGFVSVARAVDLAVTVPMILILAPRFGGLGGAYGLLAGTSLRLGLLWAGVVFQLRAPFPRLWLDRSDVAAARSLFRREP